MEGTFVAYLGNNQVTLDCGGVLKNFAIDPTCKTCGGSPRPGDRLRIDGQPAVKIENLSRLDTGNKVADAAAKGFYGTDDPRVD